MGSGGNEDWRVVWRDEFNREGRLWGWVWKYEEGYVGNEEGEWYEGENGVCKGGLVVMEGGKEGNGENGV